MAYDHGISRREIESLTNDDDPTWSDRTRILLTAADELFDTKNLSAPTYQRLRGELDENQILEFCMLVGHYVMAAMMLTSPAARSSQPSAPTPHSGQALTCEDFGQQLGEALLFTDAEPSGQREHELTDFGNDPAREASGLSGEADSHRAAVGRIDALFHQPALHRTVDEPADGRALQPQVIGEFGHRRLPVAQYPQHPQLGEG
jgi:hypothetical protein